MQKNIVGFYLFSFIIITVFMNGCSKPTDEELYYEMHKTLNSIESYRCIADITIKGNKNPDTHKAKHIYIKPNKYIIEILSPEENKGNITLYDGKQAWLYSPQIEQSFLLKNYEQTKEEYLFIGYFLRNIMTTENVEIASDKIEEEEFIVLTTEIPGNYKYRRYEKLWISKKGFIPYRLVVLDNNNNISVEVIYSNFKYNLDIDDSQFNIKTGVDIIKEL